MKPQGSLKVVEKKTEKMESEKMWWWKQSWSNAIYGLNRLSAGFENGRKPEAKEHITASRIWEKQETDFP